MDDNRAYGRRVNPARQPSAEDRSTQCRPRQTGRTLFARSWRQMCEPAVPSSRAAIGQSRILGRTYVSADAGGSRHQRSLPVAPRKSVQKSRTGRKAGLSWTKSASWRWRRATSIILSGGQTAGRWAVTIDNPCSETAAGQVIGCRYRVRASDGDTRDVRLSSFGASGLPSAGQRKPVVLERADHCGGVR
jgi:hypothetical protein